MGGHEDELQDEAEEEQPKAKRRMGGEEGVGSSHPELGAAPTAPAPAPAPPLASPPPMALPEALSLILLGRMMPMALMRILFYLDRPDLLLVVAVLSKHMNGMAKHNVLWRLTITDKRDTSGRGWYCRARRPGGARVGL